VNTLLHNHSPLPPGEGIGKLTKCYDQPEFPASLNILFLPIEILPYSVFFWNINPQLATMDLWNCWPFAEWMWLDSWQRRDFFSRNHVQTSSGNRYGTTAHKRPCFQIPQIHGIHSTCVNQLEHNADPTSYCAKVTNVSTMSTFMMWCLVHRLYSTCFTHETIALYSSSTF